LRDRHRFSVFNGGLEAPLLHRADRLGFQAGIQTAEHRDLGGQSGGIDDQIQNDRALDA